MLGITVGLALLLGGLFGRFFTPTRVVEKEVKVVLDREIEGRSIAYVGHTETAIKTNTVWVTREERKPDGTVIIETKGQQGTDVASKQDVAKQEIQIREVVKYQEVIHERLVESPSKDWLVAGGVGINLDAKPTYQVQVHRRLLGPIHGGLWVQGQSLEWRAAAVGVTLGFAF